MRAHAASKIGGESNSREEGRWRGDHVPVKSSVVGLPWQGAPFKAAIVSDMALRRASKFTRKRESPSACRNKRRPYIVVAWRVIQNGFEM